MSAFDNTTRSLATTCVPLCSPGLILQPVCFDYCDTAHVWLSMLSKNFHDGCLVSHGPFLVTGHLHGSFTLPLLYTIVSLC
jgi:hypothetical protein